MCKAPRSQFPEFNIANFVTGKNYVIEASAGTGKTYTIVEMVKKLLQSGITLDRMQIVTYTEKAAGELKDRIRAALAALPKEVKNDIRNDVDNASIGTIHAFCQNTISEYFISAGKPSFQKLIDEGEIADFLKRYLREGDIYREICAYKRDNPEDNIEGTLTETITAAAERFYLNAEGQADSSVIDLDKSSDYECLSFSSEAVQKAIQCFLRSKTEKLRCLAQEILDKKSVVYNGKAIRIAKDWTSEEQEAYRVIQDAKKVQKNQKNAFIYHLASKYLSDIYKAWQKEKENLCEQTYNDMIRDVREEIVRGGPLLGKLKEKYTYAVIDEFQDTNQKQWDIFKTVFLSEKHHLIVVGDPKQSIYSFQGADVSVYQKAVEEIEQNGGICRSLKHNYRATGDIIRSTNAFFDKTDNPQALPTDMNFTPSEVGNPNFKVRYRGKEIKAFWIPGEEVTPEEYAKMICNRIVDFCTKEESGETRLQIWDKDGNQRSVSFGDFAVLARTRSEMKPFQSAFETCGIPYAQYKDSRLFSGRECANWIALLEAIQAPDFTGNNRMYFRKAMFTYFFGYPFDAMRSSDFDKDSGKEMEMLSDWRDLAASREWARLIERIIVDSDLAEKLQSLGDMKAFGVLLQIGEYCIDYLTRTDNLAMLIKNLRKQASDKNDEEEEDENSGLIAKSTDIACVHIMTIHASKGLEFPIVISTAGFRGESNQSKVYTYHDEEGHARLTFGKNDSATKEIREEYQRLFYVAYTRAKYLLMLPLFTRKNGTFDFVKQTVREYQKQKGNKREDAVFDYEPMFLDENIQSLENLKDIVRKICADSAPKEAEEHAFEQREEWLKKEFAPALYRHILHKHAYSSLSHNSGKDTSRKEMEPTHAEEDTDSQSADHDIIENDILKHNHETEDNGETSLSAYDKSAKQIACAYSSVEPPTLSPNFIAGAALGNALHRIFELIDYTQDNRDIDELIITCFAEEKINCKDEWVSDVKKMVQNVTSAKLPTIHGSIRGKDDFSLKNIAPDQRKNEVEFNFNIFTGGKPAHYMNGFVDLIFRRGEYYSILDWKSDRLDDDAFTAYNDGKILKEHVDELYSVQRVLYSYCLIKWLKQFYPGKTESDIFADHFGGVYYVFLRGCNEGTGNGVYAQTWEDYETLRKEYHKIVKEKVCGYDRYEIL